MALSAAAMVTFYKANLQAVGITFEHSASEAIITAMFQSIIDDIAANAVVTTTVVGGSSDGEHSGVIA